MIVELIKPQGRFRIFKRSRYRLVSEILIAGNVVPVDFISDGASLPPLVRIFFDPMGIWAEAAFLHDYLLKKMSREEAALNFYSAMRELGVPYWVRKLFYGAVRVYDFYVLHIVNNA